jgi:hypothetical protein
MNADGRAEGARTLILAVFRLAVADYLGVSYGHDGHVRRRRVSPVHRDDAAVFLESEWAGYMADLIGLSSAVIWSQSRRQLDRDSGRRLPTAA